MGPVLIDSPRLSPAGGAPPTAPGAAYTRPRMRRILEGAGDPAFQSSRAWIEALRDEGPARDRAISDLHSLLLGAARFEVTRRRAALSHVRGEELQDIAMQAANDALVAVLAKLDDYRGASRFTTWAYKFALLEVGVRLRRRAWQGHEVVLEPEAWPAVVDGRSSAHDMLEHSQMLEALKTALNEALTARQREVFIALALNEVPIDVLAERLNTTRGALYKTLHDARHRLRQELAAAGFVEPYNGTVALEEDR